MGDRCKAQSKRWHGPYAWNYSVYPCWNRGQPCRVGDKIVVLCSVHRSSGDTVVARPAGTSGTEEGETTNGE